MRRLRRSSLVTDAINCPYPHGRLRCHISFQHDRIFQVYEPSKFFKSRKFEITFEKFEIKIEKFEIKFKKCELIIRKYNCGNKGI